MSLLMLATLLVYATPGHAGLDPHQHAAVPHEHALVDAHDHAVPDHGYFHEHDQAPCKESGRLDSNVCCSIAQCAIMHGGLLAAAINAFIPRLDRSLDPPVLATPEGIGGAPALRPPSLTI